MAVFDARPSGFTQMTTTTEWERLYSAANIPDGIDDNVGSQMVPSLDTPGRNIVIADGSAIIKGLLWRCDAPVSTAIPAASAQNRIDRLVLRLNRGASTSATVIQPTVITGTPSGSPVAPAISQTPTGLWDVTLASWTAASGGGLSGLTDERQFAWTTHTIPYNDSQTINSTSFINFTGMSVPVGMNQMYYFKFRLSFQGTGNYSVGARFRIMGPACSFISYNVIFFQHNANVFMNTEYNAWATNTDSQNLAGAQEVLLEGFFTPTTPGPLYFQGACVTSNANSWVTHVGGLDIRPVT